MSDANLLPPGERIAMLRKLVADIVDTATELGYLVTPQKVSRHLRWWALWFDGKMASGHMVMRTGVKYVGDYPPNRWKEGER